MAPQHPVAEATDTDSQPKLHDSIAKVRTCHQMSMLLYATWSENISQNLSVLPEDEKYFFRWYNNLPENWQLLMSVYIFTGNIYHTNTYFSKLDPYKCSRNLFQNVGSY